jgi:multiple sugar transport system ATP-binding protein
LYHHPRNLFVGGFIGSPKMNFIIGEISEPHASGATVLLPSGARIKAAVDASKAKAGDKVTLGIRPEHASDGAADGNFVEAKVMLVEPMGEATYVYLETSGSTDGLIVRMAADVGHVMGNTVRIGLPEKNCHLFDAGGLAFKRLAVAPTALAA